MMQYKSFCIDKNQSLRDAMRQLDVTAQKILFVMDQDRIVGSLTDGDLRRFLLGGGTLDAQVIAAAFKTPQIALNRNDALAILRAGRYAAVPIISPNGRLTDILFADGQSLDQLPRLGLPVVIMAGGKGTRLDPYTRVLPKPLIPVGELPIIEHIMQQFSKYGCDEFHIIVNHKKQLIKAYFAENERGYNIHWYDEEKPLGTGGGLAMLQGKLHGTFFLTNCDVLIQTDYDDVLRFHREGGNAVTMICAYKNVTIPYGVIETGANGEILEMKEKPELSFQTNTGMYLVEAATLDSIEPDVPVGFPDVIQKEKEKGKRIAAYPVSENAWLDMGQLAELDKMRERLYGE